MLFSPIMLFNLSNYFVGFFFYFKHTVGFLSSRILFKDKDRNWEEIENKLRAESEVPIVKTSSMVWIVTFSGTDCAAHLMAK